MPKILENPQPRLMAEAKQQILEKGYQAVTIRSVANGCGIGVGTVYNYFPSKDDLVAAFMLEDWNGCIRAIEEVSHDACAPQPVLQCIYGKLQAFARLYAPIMEDPAARSVFASGLGRYHGLLRQQLAKPLEKFCQTAFDAEFIAEALLTWTMVGKEFGQIENLILKLF